MRLKLDPVWTERLAHLPESGMGYQRVRVHLRDGRTLDEAIVLNGQYLQIPEDEVLFVGGDILTIETR